MGGRQETEDNRKWKTHMLRKTTFPLVLYLYTSTTKAVMTPRSSSEETNCTDELASSIEDDETDTDLSGFIVEDDAEDVQGSEPGSAEWSQQNIDTLRWSRVGIGNTPQTMSNVVEQTLACLMELKRLLELLAISDEKFSS